MLALLAESSEDLLVLQWTLLEAAFVPLAAGRWDEAAARFERARDVGRERGQTVHDAPFAAGLCWLHRSRGDYDEAVALAREVAETTYGFGAGEWAAWLDAELGWALLESGDPAGAVEVLARGAQTAEAIAAPNPRARCTSLLAWAHSSMGDFDAARDALGRAEAALARDSRWATRREPKRSSRRSGHPRRPPVGARSRRPPRWSPASPAAPPVTTPPPTRP